MEIYQFYRAITKLIALYTLDELLIYFSSEKPSLRSRTIILRNVNNCVIGINVTQIFGDIITLMVTSLSGPIREPLPSYTNKLRVSFKNNKMLLPMT